MAAMREGETPLQTLRRLHHALDAGYEAARAVMPIELRPPHGPISPELLRDMVWASLEAVSEVEDGSETRG